ncbi:MAG: tRNA (adenosine(37)-N6)-threonylcarbamoyltransferase complex dimerization subunit type 1 TsaB [Spirosomaceae bacterium]|nr:tRNA (adenosine(37)-N6)-threonylcarbamoyltransferase complex dimerization subunit type 1 TsaB [Spirosomataceae bacterium]
MVNILSIESAVSGFSVAVHQNGKLLSAVELYNERVASSLLTLAIEQVAAFSELQLSDLNAIAVSEGPGSYTGLRIGVSTAKGLCLALDLPLISVNTLEIMCHGLNLTRHADVLLCPLIDARRMEVYAAVFSGEEISIVEEVSAKVVDESTFQPLLANSQVLFVGNGAEKTKSLYEHNPNALYLKEVVFPAAKNMGTIAWKKFQNEQFEPLVDFEPQYLKPYFATTPKNQLSPQ